MEVHALMLWYAIFHTYTLMYSSKHVHICYNLGLLLFWHGVICWWKWNISFVK